MTEPENISLSHLVALGGELKSLRSEVHEGFDNLGRRMSDLESALVATRRDVNHGSDVDARLQVTIDQLTSRVRTIERRLDLERS